MISLNVEQYEKIRLIDALFNAIDINELKEYADSERIISILKGSNDKSSILVKLIHEHDLLSMELNSLKAEHSNLKNDLQSVIKLLLKPNDYNAHSDASALKSKYGIY